MIEALEYEVFDPTKVSGNIPKLIDRTAKQKVYGRIPRLLMFLTIPVLFFPVLFFTDNSKFPVGRMYGVSLFLMYIGYYCHLCWIIFIHSVDDYSENDENDKKDNKDKKDNNNNDEMKSFFRVYSLNSIIPRWADMTICYRALLFRGSPIESFSEIAAIQGGMIQNMTQSVTMFSWLLLMEVIALEVWSNQIAFGFGIIATILGTFGVFLAGLFELDPFNSKMQFAHKLGNWLKLLLLEGYLEQQIILANYSDWKWENNYWALRILAPIFLLLFGLICGGLRILKCIPDTHKWIEQQRSNKTDKKKSKNTPMDEKTIDEINKLATRNILSEIGYDCACTFALCCWLINNEECYEIIGDKGCYGNSN